MRGLIVALGFVTIWTFRTVYDALAFGWGVVGLVLLVQGIAGLWRHFRVVKRA